MNSQRINFFHNKQVKEQKANSISSKNPIRINSQISLPQLTSQRRETQFILTINK